jgi:hypothetical protein
MARPHQKISGGKRAADALESRPGSRDRRRSAVALVRQFHANGACRQAACRPVRPFDQGRALRNRVVKAQLVQLGRRGQPIEVEMVDREPRLVSLHQREGRARHLQFRIPGKRPDQAARQGRLARAEVALERQHIAGA